MCVFATCSAPITRRFLTSGTVIALEKLKRSSISRTAGGDASASIRESSITGKNTGCPLRITCAATVGE